MIVWLTFWTLVLTYISFEWLGVIIAIAVIYGSGYLFKGKNELLLSTLTVLAIALTAVIALTPPAWFFVLIFLSIGFFKGTF